MEFSKKKVIKLVITLVLLCCMFYANFFAIRMIMRYGMEAYFYDKLLVAFTVGGEKGLKLELSKIPLTDKSTRETSLAKDFTARLKNLTDPETFLKDKVNENKNMISSVRNLRNIAILFMLIIFGWQLIVNFANRLKTRKSA